MKTHVIQIDPFDDVNSVKDKMNWSNSDRILLVIPEQSICCRKKLDLVLLLRHARSLGAQLGLVTENKDTTSLAEQMKVSAYKSTAVAQRRTWHRMRKNSIQLEKQSKAKVNPPEERENKSKWRPGFMESAWFRKTLFGMGVLACLVLILIFIPHATVTLALNERIEDNEVIVHVETDLTSPDLTGGLPARLLTVTLVSSSLGDSSGSTIAPDSYATGTITLTNLTNTALVIPAGELIASGGDGSIKFSTQNEVELPAEVGSSVEVLVKAVLPGEKGNISEGDLNVVLGTLSGQVLATNTAATMGGTNTVMASPTEADIEKVRLTILEKLGQEALEFFSSGIDEGERLIEASLKVEEITSEEISPRSGQPADQFSITMEVVFSSLVYNQSDLEQLGKMILNANIPAGWTAKRDSFYMTPITSPTMAPDGQVSWSISIAQLLLEELNVQPLIHALLGKNRSDAQDYLESNLDLRESPLITISPSFWPWMPLLPFQARIEFK